MEEINTTAIWKNGPLNYIVSSSKYKRNNSYKQVVLKYFQNSQNVSDEFLNKVKSYLTTSNNRWLINSSSYGMSQNSDTKDYVFVFHLNYLKSCCEDCGEGKIYKWCKSCQNDYLKSDFANWTSGDKKIDNFIQKKQLQTNSPWDTTFEWIPYDKLSDIRKIKNIGATAIWKDGPLKFNEYLKKYVRNSNKNVALKFFYNSQNINEFLNKVKSYLVTSQNYNYGVSQDPYTQNYILVLHEKYFETYCKYCGKYAYYKYKRCKSCQIDYLKYYLTNWTSGDRQIDNFIQEKQLQTKDTIFEWIPYDQFNDIRQVENIGAIATWKDGPLKFNEYLKTYIRYSNTNVALKYLYGLHISIEFLKMVKLFLIEDICYGISQNPDTKNYIFVFHHEYFEKYCEICYKEYTNKKHKWCNPCQISYLENNHFVNRTGGNKQIDVFIQEKRLQIDGPQDIVFEWIPYNQFNIIREIKKIGATATWKDGPLKFNGNSKKYEKKLVNKKVTLKYLYNLRYITKEYLSKVLESYLTTNIVSYGMSQNPNTKGYIFVFCEEYSKYFEEYCKECGKVYTNKQRNWCKPCQINYLKWHFISWTSGNGQIDNFIQQRQLQIDNSWERVFEWIPYDQFNIIREIENIGTIAMWKYSPLEYSTYLKRYEKKFIGEKIVLKYLHNTRYIFDEFLNKVKFYFSENIINYGISQNPDTEDYVFVFHAIWKNGPLTYNPNSCEYERSLINKKVTLKYLYSLQNNAQIISSFNKFLNKVISKDISYYGISQDTNTKDYILIFHKKYFENYCDVCDEEYTNKQYKWCNPCQINYLKWHFISWTSGNKQIDCFIQKKQLQINRSLDVVFEWIPYNQFSNIKETGNGCATAVWKDGPLNYNFNEKKWMRKSDKKVTIKYLHNTQNIINNKFLNKVKSEDISYGISQDPETENYIFVLNKKYFEKYCEYCDEENAYSKQYKWCKTCLISYLKNNFANWTSGNKQIDDFIQERQLQITQIDILEGFVFEWIPYNQFSSIKERGNGFAMATWKDMLLKFNKWNSNRDVVLKCLYNSQYISDEFLNKVKSYLTEEISYGMSQNPITKDYILVFHEKIFENSFEYLNDYLEKCMEEHFGKYCAKCGKEHTNEVYKWCKSCIIDCKNIKVVDIIKNSSKIKWISYNQFNDVEEIGKGGFATVYSAILNESYMNEKVALKCLHNSQNFIHEFLNEVEVYLAYTNQKFATGRQPFSDRAHDKSLVLDICNGIRPEINEQKVPECYIELMKMCWDSNPNDRPNAVKIEEYIWLFHYSNTLNASEFEFFMKIEKSQEHYEIEKQFKEAEEFRKENPISIKDIQLNTHPQAIYTSRLLNSFTKDLPSECLDCSIDEL
ncbi:kinase-like domain-containing protein [Rhizophagus clarus]|uniref:Kinase-like domain-containing protein n=1 Tax=Rhizophagus clarus TaxID=94130 RepID=A0A8H3LZG9_9GLOM|nr:kinase-like domain-containing protein [Rhizophagus clarus]